MAKQEKGPDCEKCLNERECLNDREKEALIRGG